MHATGPPFPAPTKRFQRRMGPSTVNAAMAYAHTLREGWSIASAVQFCAFLYGGALRMAATTNARSEAPLEARIDAELDDLISEAADRLEVTKTAFVSEALREAALKVIARSDITMMDPKVFDSMMASIDIADESSELHTLAALPRRITR